MPAAVFGPCMSCTGAQLSMSIPITVVDDMDLELGHSFMIAIMSIDPAGVGMMGSPQTVTINDNGQLIIIIQVSAKKNRWFNYAKSIMIYTGLAHTLYTKTTSQNRYIGQCPSHCSIARV